jgi:hypothetical protein
MPCSRERGSSKRLEIRDLDMAEIDHLLRTDEAL